MDSTSTIEFMGGALVPGLPRKLTLDLTEPITIDGLVTRLEGVLGIVNLRAKLTEYFIITVDGTTIQHLRDWQTLVFPGARVAILAPMGGGGGTEENLSRLALEDSVGE